MPTGPQVDLMSNSSPRACLARLACQTPWNSGVSGGFWPLPGGKAGSQAPTGLPRIHSASQSGYFLASSALARSGNNRAAASVAAPIELLVSMGPSFAWLLARAPLGLASEFQVHKN